MISFDLFFRELGVVAGSLKIGKDLFSRTF